MGTAGSKGRSPSFEKFPTVEFDVPIERKDGAEGSGGNWSPGLEPKKQELYESTFLWDHGGDSVYITGSFSNWEERIKMKKQEGGVFKVVFKLTPGSYQYKFIVDGDWRFAPDQPTTFDGFGNVNNLVEIAPAEGDEVLDNDDILDNAEPWTQDIPGPKDLDYSNPPPALPPHLHRIILNKVGGPRLTKDNTMLPVPHHVTLNHVYTSSHPVSLGVTFRTGTKFVTHVYYKAGLDSMDEEEF